MKRPTQNCCSQSVIKPTMNTRIGKEGKEVQHIPKRLDEQKKELMTLGEIVASLGLFKQKLQEHNVWVKRCLPYLSPVEMKLSQLIESGCTQMCMKASALERSIAEAKALLANANKAASQIAPYKSAAKCGSELNALKLKLAVDIRTLEKLLNGAFFQHAKQDLSNILMYVQLEKTHLVLINTDTQAIKSIDLKPYSVASTVSLAIIGGPALERANNTVYLIGGLNQRRASNVVVALVFTEGQFTAKRLADLKYPRYDISTVIWRNKHLYAVTGAELQDREVHLRYTERYSVAHNVWVTLRPVNVARSIPGLCLFGERQLYLYGGQLDNSISGHDLEVYDTYDDEAGWRLITLSSALLQTIKACDCAIIRQVSPNEMLILHRTAANYIDVYENTLRKATAQDFSFNYNIYYMPTYCSNHKLYVFASGQNGGDYYDMWRRTLSPHKIPTHPH